MFSGAKMKIGAVIQARTSSTRLPRKILKDLPYGSGITVLQQVINRLKKSRKLDDIIVATTIDKADEEIVRLSKKEKVKWFQGSMNDVLERYYLAAKENNLDIVVRITSDCPCIDFEVVDFLIREHLRIRADYTANALVRTYPHGLDVEVLNFVSLEKAHKEAKDDFIREHVCPYIYRVKPEAFKIHSVKAPCGLTAPEIRVTLDTEEDYALLCAVFDYLYLEKKYFNICDIVKIFKEKPWLRLINKKIIQKKTFDTLEEEVQEAVRILDLQDLKRAKEALGRYS